MSWPLILGFVILVVGFTIVYNRLVALRQERKNAFADIDVQLKLRHDLVPNLAETVKKYAAHEKTVFENVTQARSRAMQAQSIGEKSQAETALGGSLMKLLAVAENYPELKADKNFANFQAQLADIEKSVAASRRFFNNATAEYNSAIQQFPALLVAKSLGFHDEAFFDVGVDNRNALDAPVAVSL